MPLRASRAASSGASHRWPRSATVAALLAGALAPAAARPQAPSAAAGQSGPDGHHVLLDRERIGRALEALHALGLVRTLHAAQRPYPDGVVADALAEVRARLDSLAAGLAGTASAPAPTPDQRARLAGRLAAGRAILVQLARVGGAEGAGPPRPWGAAHGASLVATHSTAEPRVTPSADLGASDALINPLGAGRGGRPLERGTTAFVETAHVLRAAGVMLDVRPRLRATPVGAGARYGDTRAVTFQELALHAAVGPVGLTVGRTPMHWGPSAGGGLALSPSAPPLDLARVRSERPFHLPWLLRRLGPASATAFVARMGAAEAGPGSHLSGWKVSVLPHPRLEVGASLLSQWGGRGAPPATALEHVVDHLIFYDMLPATPDLQISNKLAGADVRLRVPGGVVYWEMQLDDIDVTEYHRMFVHDAGHLVGLTLPVLGRGAHWEVTAEGRHTGLRFYQHAQFRGGLARERVLLGDPLGPNGRGGYLRVARRAPTTGGQLALDLALERRSNDHYAVIDPPFRFVKSRDLPEEWRHRAVLSWEGGPPARGVRWLLRGGVERARGFAYRSGDDRTHALLEVGTAFGR